MEEIILNETQKDALQELANIGAGHASTVLSQMINRDICMGIPTISVIPLEKTIDLIKNEKVVVGIFLKICEEIPSYVLLLIQRESAFALANMLLGHKPDPSKEILSEMDESALLEVSNVMICAFFDSFSEFLNTCIVPSPPVLAFDIPSAVMDYVLIQMGELADKVVVFNIQLAEEKKENFKINMLLMPEPDSLDIILEKLGVGRMILKNSSIK